MKLRVKDTTATDEPAVDMWLERIGADVILRAQRTDLPSQGTYTLIRFVAATGRFKKAMYLSDKLGFDLTTAHHSLVEDRQ